MVGLLQAPVGTQLHSRLKRENRLAGLISCNTDGTTNIIPRMELKALCDGYKKILSYIYSPKHYYARVKTFLEEYRTPKVSIPLPLAITFAIYGHHFRKVCEIHIL